LSRVFVSLITRTAAQRLWTYILLLEFKLAPHFIDDDG
jgi:hypothetical protein